VNRPTRNSDQPDWFNLELWGKQADVAANYVRKGSLVGIKGALKFDSWIDKNSGSQRTSPVIVVERLQLLGSKRDSEAGSGEVSTYEDDF
jgi:single-strand DNA-binding protein